MIRIKHYRLTFAAFDSCKDYSFLKTRFNLSLYRRKIFKKFMLKKIRKITPKTKIKRLPSYE